MHHWGRHLELSSLLLGGENGGNCFGKLFGPLDWIWTEAPCQSQRPQRPRTHTCTEMCEGLLTGNQSVSQNWGNEIGHDQGHGADSLSSLCRRQPAAELRRARCRLSSMNFRNRTEEGLRWKKSEKRLPLGGGLSDCKGHKVASGIFCLLRWAPGSACEKSPSCSLRMCVLFWGRF